MVANFCSYCGSTLRPEDNLCAHCGLHVADIGDDNSTTHAVGPNRLLFEQTVDKSRLEASFSDATAEHLKDVVQTLVVGKIIRPAVMRPVVVGAASHPDDADDADLGDLHFE